MQVIELFVTKNKVVETDLQLAKTVKLRKNTLQRATRSSFSILPSTAALHPVVSRKFGNRVSFSHSKLSISNTIYRRGKTFRAALEFINVHL